MADFSITDYVLISIKCKALLSLSVPVLADALECDQWDQIPSPPSDSWTCRAPCCPRCMKDPCPYDERRSWMESKLLKSNHVQVGIAGTWPRVDTGYACQPDWAASWAWWSLLPGSGCPWPALAPLPTAGVSWYVRLAESVAFRAHLPPGDKRAVNADGS